MSKSNKSSSATSSKVEEELKDPWANIPNDTDPPASKPTQPLLHSLSTPPPQSPFVSEGKLDDLPCSLAIFAGSVIGTIGGAVFNAVGRQQPLAGAFQGAATMAAVSAVQCTRMKARGGTIYDLGHYDRAYAYAAGGFVWPIAGELYRSIRRQPILPPAIGFRRAVVSAIAGGALGGIMDHFDLFRPVKPENTPPKKVD